MSVRSARTRGVRRRLVPQNAEVSRADQARDGANQGQQSPLDSGALSHLKRESSLAPVRRSTIIFVSWTGAKDRERYEQSRSSLVGGVFQGRENANDYNQGNQPQRSADEQCDRVGQAVVVSGGSDPASAGSDH